jgi:hypothetical protein
MFHVEHSAPPEIPGKGCKCIALRRTIWGEWEARGKLCWKCFLLLDLQLHVIKVFCACLQRMVIFETLTAICEIFRFAKSNSHQLDRLNLPKITKSSRNVRAKEAVSLDFVYSKVTNSLTKSSEKLCSSRFPKARLPDLNGLRGVYFAWRSSSRWSLSRRWRCPRW